MAISYIGFVAFLYPIIRKYNVALSVGFVGFRFLAGVFNIIGVIIILMLLTLSKKFIEAEAPTSSHFQTIGVLLKSGRDVVNHVAMILVHCSGCLMIYSILYKTKLIPRWLSSWGLISTVLTIFASFLIMFYVIDIITSIYIVLSLPMALLEIVFAIWLIIKGFNQSVLDSDY